jgi:hypothetical protein
MMRTLPGKADRFAAMEGAGVSMFNDVEEMAEAAGLLARYPKLRALARSDNLSDVEFATVAAAEFGLFTDLTGDFHGCCIFATFCWTCGLSVASIARKEAKAWGADRSRSVSRSWPPSTGS